MFQVKSDVLNRQLLDILVALVFYIRVNDESIVVPRQDTPVSIDIPFFRWLTDFFNSQNIEQKRLITNFFPVIFRVKR